MPTDPLDAAPDVPCSEDLRDPVQAKAWADAADRRRPLRVRVRAVVVAQLARLPRAARVLELGSGPGFLAERVLAHCPHLAGYTLFDVSEPMLQMSRARVGRYAAATFALGDFRSEGWAGSVQGLFDAVVSMQAVHEVRHKRHVPRLYSQIHDLLTPGGLFLMCDRTPEDDSARSTALFMTAAEQLQALRGAGFVDVRVVMSGDALALCECRRSGGRRTRGTSTPAA